MSAVERGALHALAYADIFDYPLTAAEAHRYLSVPAKPSEVRAGLDRLAGDRLHSRDGFYALPGRGEIVDARRARADRAALLWPHALHYGRLLAGLPFVRMVAVTGSLALDNADEGSDLDYLLVTAPGRVWVVRALSSLVRRSAARAGIHVCPNYILSERSLALREHNLFTAHELLQMVPIAGAAVYRRMLRINDWAAAYLPNAAATAARGGAAPPAWAARVTRAAELALRSPIGTLLERSERARLTRKLARRGLDRSEVEYTVDCCKDHVDARGRQVLSAYEARVAALGELS